VHAYEDCSLLQFQAARRKGLACVYDMPIGYYGSWDRISPALMARFAGWAPEGGVSESRHVRPAQKAAEMALADLVLAPSAFVAETILEHRPDARVAIAPYGVDAERWGAGEPSGRGDGPLRFLFVGQCSIRKGVPLLVEAWKAAGLKDARLDLVGSWGLRRSRLADLPPGIAWTPPVGQDALAGFYRAADVFVFPTFFEGRALVTGEAMASGLPVVTTPASGAADLVDEQTGRLIEAGSLEELVETLRWFADHRERVPEMGAAARAKALACTWDAYRDAVRAAVGAYA
jgi:glycosyltransferase involved in cell wall biosynthesis